MLINVGAARLQGGLGELSLPRLAVLIMSSFAHTRVVC